jgi:hypothetical protein
MPVATNRQENSCNCEECEHFLSCLGTSSLPTFDTGVEALGKVLCIFSGEFIDVQPSNVVLGVVTEIFLA